MSLVYKAGSLGVSVAGGVVAGAIFKQVWKLAAGDDDTPDAGDLERSWTEVLVAAAIHGAIFGLVKSATHRAGAQAAAKRGKDAT
ncbi:DUF4235 domain-containing protein [Actinomadura flavalba]|uniref:DUF4235 domain-containing protein n=1 Tax=Actinomadura flavalba TaxID=1120938 RepID=UPI0003664B00|nr:DUF4235 domain-containing protein [Actinomadura flavalba]